MFVDASIQGRGSSPRHDGVQSLDRHPQVLAHQKSPIRGSHPSHLSLRLSGDSFRQCDSGLVHSQAGLHSILQSPKSGISLLPADRSTRSTGSDPSHSRLLQHPGGRSLQTRQAGSDGVAAPQRCLPSVLPSSSQPKHRPVCDSAEPPASVLWVSGSRPPCLGDRRPQRILGRSQRICVPASSTSSSLAVYDTIDPSADTDFGRALVAGPTLVPRVKKLASLDHLPLPSWPNLLVHPVNHQRHPTPDRFHLHAWSICRGL